MIFHLALGFGGQELYQICLLHHFVASLAMKRFVDEYNYQTLCRNIQ